MLSYSFRSVFLSAFKNSHNIKSILRARIFYRESVVTKLKYPRSSLNFFILSNVFIARMEGNKYFAIEEKVKTGENYLTPESTIKEADELFLIGKFKESYLLLTNFKDSDNVEILWRLGRALFNISKQKGINKNDREFYIIEAYEYVEKALKLDNENYAVHKWMAILADAKSSLDGIKARISTLPVFKHHLMMAIQLNPKDATSIYMLGLYMYNIADMSRMQITIAKALFGAIPEASFEEAFTYFSRAEEVDPNFYSANLLMLGKTCLKLKRIEAARYWLKCATSYPVRTDEDEAVKLEAEILLKKYSRHENELNRKEEKNTQEQ